MVYLHLAIRTLRIPKMKKLLLVVLVLLVGIVPEMDAQVLSYFSWDNNGANELIADVGPNATSSGANAEAQSAGNGTPQGLAPGNFTQTPTGFCCVVNCDPCCTVPNTCGNENINMIVPNPGNMFDVPEVRYSIDFRNNSVETEAWFFTRDATSASGPRFRMGLQFERFKVEFSTNNGSVVNHDVTLFGYWSGAHEVPRDNVWRNFAFEYTQATGIATFYVDGAVALTFNTGTPGAPMVWPTTPISIGPNCDNEGNDAAIFDNAEVRIPTPLPVTYGYITGEQVGLRNRIDWETIVESNSSHFIVTRATENGEFEELGRVTGAGTTADAQQYRFYDDNPQEGINFYRLEQVDINGNTSHSQVVQVHFDVDRSGLLAVYPNPISSEQTLNIKFATDGERVLNLQILDLQGRIVYDRNHEVTEDIMNLEVPMYDLPNGMYITRVVAEGKAWSKKFTKQ